MRSLLLLSSACLLGACSGDRGPLAQPGDRIVVPVAPTGVPGTVAGAAASGPYLIGPLDKLRIDTLQEPSLTIEELSVDTAGNISLPLAGQVRVGGLTAPQASDAIAARLARYVRTPRVAVNVTEFNSQKVTVQGAVNQAGVFDAPGGVSLLQSIALAQGLGEFARADEIIVFRNEGDQRYAARFDLGAIQSGQMADPTLRAGDIVVVGTSGARRFFRDILAVLPFAAGIFISLTN